MFKTSAYMAKQKHYLEGEFIMKELLQKVTETINKRRVTVFRREKEKRRCTSGPECYIQITDSKHSNGNKEIIAISVEDWLLERDKMIRDGYADKNSTDLCTHLNREFPEGNWQKNASQRPFDTYSVSMLVAIELKGLTNEVGSRTRSRKSKDQLVMNATLYATEAYVRDVVPKHKHHLYTEEQLDMMMDVIVVCFERMRGSGRLLGYKIVDGAYWDIDYKTQKDCWEAFGQLNDEDTKAVLYQLMSERYPNSVFWKGLANNTLDINMDFRKLITIKNPINN